jgi:hypothetical protein
MIHRACLMRWSVTTVRNVVIVRQLWNRHYARWLSRTLTIRTSLWLLSNQRWIVRRWYTQTYGGAWNWDQMLMFILVWVMSGITTWRRLYSWDGCAARNWHWIKKVHESHVSKQQSLNCKDESRNSLAVTNITGSTLIINLNYLRMWRHTYPMRIFIFSVKLAQTVS